MKKKDKKKNNPRIEPLIEKKNLPYSLSENLYRSKYSFGADEEKKEEKIYYEWNRYYP